MVLEQAETSPFAFLPWLLLLSRIQEAVLTDTFFRVPVRVETRRTQASVIL